MRPAESEVCTYTKKNSRSATRSARMLLASSLSTWAYCPPARWVACHSQSSDFEKHTHTNLHFSLYMSMVSNRTVRDRQQPIIRSGTAYAESCVESGTMVHEWVVSPPCLSEVTACSSPRFFQLHIVCPKLRHVNRKLLDNNA